MKRFLFAHRVEISVVSVLLLVLLVVMWPRFWDAQTRASVAQAKRVLSGMTQWLMTYNLNPAHAAHSQVIVKIDEENAVEATAHLSYVERTAQGEFVDLGSDIRLLNNEERNDIASRFPALPQQWDGSSEMLFDFLHHTYHCGYRSNWGAADPLYHKLFAHEIQKNSIPPSHDQFRLTSVYAFVAGPYLDYRLPWSHRMEKDRFYYLYDPSNGLMSHGFLHDLKNNSALGTIPNIHERIVEKPPEVVVPPVGTTP